MQSEIKALMQVGMDLIKTITSFGKSRRRCRTVSKLQVLLVDSRSTQRLTWLILTKDRPLQFDALLRSLKESLGCAAPCEVLYRATSDRSLKAYYEVFTRHADLVPRPRRETKFNRDVIEMVSATRGDRVAFLVDDLVFVSPVDLGLVLAVDPCVATYSFRLGLRIVRCQTHDVPSGRPPFVKPKGLPEQWLAWPWSMGKGDWWVRNSLDGNVLSRDLLLAGLHSNRNFQGPQTLEEMLCGCRFGTELGVCNMEPQAINIAINRVSSERKIYPHGTVSADDLLHAWESGLQVDLPTLRAMRPDSCHVVCDLPLEPRR